MSTLTVGPCPVRKCDGTIEGRSGEAAACDSCGYEYAEAIDAVVVDGGDH